MHAVAERTVELSRSGAPVLVGTRTVAASEELAALLADRKVPFALLNAVQDADEAAIVARAGEPGRITIATNMAGRGTDIVLDAGSRETGGLHVLMTERHEAARIDRQLAGRCARQGDPGVFQAFLSLEDDLLVPGRLPGWLRVARRLAWVFPPLTPWISHRAQRRLEVAHARARRLLLRTEGHLDRALALTGPRE
jgi:preprotein translocase subunit SecA